MEDFLLGGAALWLVLNVLAIWLFQGRWRTAALVPAAIMVLAIGVAVLGVMSGSNLAPIWVVFAVPICLAWVAVLWIAKGLVWAMAK